MDALTAATLDAARGVCLLSKWDALRTELNTARSDNPDAKCLIFSQFQPTIEFLKKKLASVGINFRSLSGDMSLAQRSKALEEFQNDPPTTVRSARTRVDIPFMSTR